ncbi:MAG: RluA family pseudouridine synthase [Pseudomonadota bacterium]
MTTGSTDHSSVSFRKVVAEDTGLRLDRWFKLHFPGLGRGGLERMLRKGQIRVDGSRVKSNARVEEGQAIRIPPDVPTVHTVQGGNDGGQRPRKVVLPHRADAEEFLHRCLVFEDDSIIAINKPHGLAVQGGSKTKTHVDGYLQALNRSGERPRLVHRLDRDTGGLLVLAKDRKSAARLGEAFQKHTVEKTYWALTATTPRPLRGHIDLPLVKREASTKTGLELVETDQSPEARKAYTDYQTIEHAGIGPAFVALRPLTGRTHQLRVHCTAIDAPIVGDGKYGGAAAKIDGVDRRLHLFCRSMSFPHPKTSRRVSINAELTGYMQKTWRFFGFSENVSVDWQDFE